MTAQTDTTNTTVLSFSALPCAKLIGSMQQFLQCNDNLSNIYTFTHVRVYNDNSAFVISSNNDWFHSSVKINEQECIPGYNYYEKGTTRFLWRNSQEYLYDRATHVAVASQHINVESALTVQIKSDLYSDRFVFADTREKTDLLAKLINHPTLVDTIIQEYYQQSDDLFNEANKNKFLIRNPLIKPTEIITAKQFPTNSVNAFLTQTLKLNVDLSERDYLFVIMSIYGIKPKKIAKHFHVSARTVENRLQLTRCKLRCNSTQQVFALFHKSGAFNLYFRSVAEDLVSTVV